MENSMQDLFAFDDATPHFQLPQNGIGKTDILKELRNLRAAEKKEFDKRGTTFVGNYTHDYELMKFQVEVFSETMKTNGLYLTEYTSLRKAESEVSSMVVDMLHGSDDCCGIVTSGGTESLLMAIKTYRDYARKELGKKGRLNFVVPDTAHCGFHKAAKYFDVDIRYVPTKNGTVQLNDIQKYVNRKTICVGLSAPSYPHGILDPVQEIASFCLLKGVGCHVDNCLGGFVMSFLDELPPWDFRVPGVTSISCDVHKYGGSIKGCSVVAYRTRELRRFQYYIAESWSGGIAFTTGMQGSKNGGLAAVAWATMLRIGRDGYRKQARSIQRTFLQLKAGLKSIPEVQLIGDPASVTIAFTLRDGLDEYQLTDCLGKKGYHLLARMQFPKCVHIVVCHRLLWGEEMVQDLLMVIRAGIDEIKEFPDRYASSAALYGSAATIPNRNLVGSCVEALVDSFLSPQQKKASPAI